MGLSALKGKRVKKKKDITRKSKTGLAHVPLTTFISMSEHIHMEVPRKEITSFVRKFVRKTFGKTYSNFSEWVYNKPTIVMSVLWKNTGNEFPPKWDHERALSSFKEDLDKAFSQYKSQEDPGTPNKSVRSPTDIIKSKTSKLIAEAEGIVDDWENNLNFSMFKELKEIDAPYIMAKSVRDFYLPLNKELEELVQVKTPDLVENYGHLTTSQRNKLYSFIGNVVSETESYMATKKAARAIRKPKVRTADKQIARLQYLKESKEYRIASINPLSIVGAARLFTFNTKHKILKELISNSINGFQVSGSTIKNVDSEESRETTLRKPEMVLHVITSKSKKLINECWNELTTKTRKTNSRINGDVILLRSMDK